MAKAVSNIVFSGFTIFLLLVSTASLAEDIELYVSETALEAERRPKVLIIFDTSGSMTTEDDVFRAPYDPSGVYGTPDSEDYIYYASGGSSTSDLPELDASRRFITAINGCAESLGALTTLGYFTGKIKRYKKNQKEWRNLPSNGNNIKVLDCKEDLVAVNFNNTQHKDGTVLPAGYPVDNQGSNSSPIYYTASAANSDAGSWSQMVTLYSAHYLRWYHYGVVPEPRTRMEVAKESVTNLIKSSPGVDFGLQIFNRNGNGGRIIHGLKETTASAKIDLLNFVEDNNHANNLVASGSTPLCESLFESYQYLSGKVVWYGDDYINDSYDYNPVRDTNIESGNNYSKPFTACNETIYIVMISDGEPTSDTQANGLIEAIGAPGQVKVTSTDKFYWTVGSSTYNSYLPALAGWMHNNDIHSTIAGRQNAEVYTIGFGANITDAAPVLAETAIRGGGEYFPATDSASLTAALTAVLANIEPSNDSLTSASVASNNFDRTETLDSVYYSMFEPSRRPRWQGNLKKYKVTNGVQVGANSVAAINETTGHFSEYVQSYWSSSVDGDLVGEGGVAEMLRNKADRIILSDLGDNYGLVGLNYTDATSSTAYPTPADLATVLGVTNDEASIQASLDWINGIDVDDDDEDGLTDDIRADVFGDPLHSKPVVINFGDNEIYIVVGTNQGVLHMFKDNDALNTIEEKWAFMPKEFLANTPILRDNLSTAEKVYGVDGLITAHIIDKNGDGIVTSGDGDKAWLFFGFRRGGNSYYAMDVTNPAAPEVMWKIKGGIEDDAFEELGQSWSQPKIAYSKLNASTTVAKPVLVFGGGYDPVKDSHSVGGVNGSDSVGKAIYMVDAELGTLIWSLAPKGNTVFAGTDSIPSSIAVIDSDGDGLTDRLYAGDTGGNVWRIDMPSNLKSEISVFKLASLGGDTLADDRRFFNEPSIVRAFITETLDSGQKDATGKVIIVQQDIPYDALLIGSGDRTHPLGNDTDDTFFMIKDHYITTQQFTASSIPAIPSTPIVIGDLANYTDNPFDETLTSQQKETLSLQVSLKSGWFMDLGLPGEKNTSSALVINNVVYFTTYTPPLSDVNSTSCDIPNGQGWLYAVDLSLGISRFESPTEDPDNPDDRKIFISEQFLGAPTLIVTPKLDLETGISEPDGNIIVGREIVPVGFKLQTLRTYLYVTEN